MSSTTLTFCICITSWVSSMHHVAAAAAPAPASRLSLLQGVATPVSAPHPLSSPNFLYIWGMFNNAVSVTHCISLLVFSHTLEVLCVSWLSLVCCILCHLHSFLPIWGSLYTSMSFLSRWVASLKSYDYARDPSHLWHVFWYLVLPNNSIDVLHYCKHP